MSGAGFFTTDVNVAGGDPPVDVRNGIIASVQIRGVITQAAKVIFVDEFYTK